MVVVPDAVLLGKGGGSGSYPDDPQSCHDVYNAVLMHCQKMQSRVGIFDVYNGYLDRDDNPFNRDVVDDFRNGVQQALNYGAAYYPWVNASVIEDNEVDYTYLNDAAIKELQALMRAEVAELYPNPKDLKRVSIEEKIDDLAGAPEVSEATQVVKGAVITEFFSKEVALAADKALADTITDYTDALNAYAQAITDAGGSPTAPSGTDVAGLNTDKETLDKEANAQIDALADAVDAAQTAYAGAQDDATKQALQDAVDALEKAEKGISLAQNGASNAQGKANAAQAAKDNADAAFTASGTDVTNGVKGVKDAVDPNQTNVNATSLHLSLMAISGAYKTVMQALKKQMNVLPPAAAMAGVYTRIDNTIGVFKAPANTGIVSVASPTVNITHDDQEELNVPLNGKAINALRTFPGYGTLVWGARTLDGNSQDWRYINVRRTLIMLEQSIKAAMQAYVFEPNVAATWSLVSSTISSFLTNQWKAGALAGASPEDAFDVAVGLGSTMTGDDILDGYMRVTIRVAIVRPAEFIVLTFQQKMQTS